MDCGTSHVLSLAFPSVESTRIYYQNPVHLPNAKRRVSPGSIWRVKVGSSATFAPVSASTTGPGTSTSSVTGPPFASAITESHPSAAHAVAWPSRT